MTMEYPAANHHVVAAAAAAAALKLCFFRWLCHCVLANEASSSLQEIWDVEDTWTINHDSISNFDYYQE